MLSLSNSSRLLPWASSALREGVLVVVELVDRVVHGVVDLRLHDLLGQRDLGLVEQHFEGLVADLLGLLDALDPLDLFLEARLQLVDGVEFACQLGEFVVGFGQLAFLDGVDGDGHLGLFAGMLTGGECRREDLGLPLLEADDRVVEAFDQLAGADLVGQALGLGVGHVLAVDGGGQVDGDEVAFFDRALDAGEGAEAGAQVLQLGVDVLVGHLDRVDLDLEGFEIGDGDVGADVDLGGEDEFFAVLELGDLDVGLTERFHLGGGDGLAVAAGQGVVDDLLEDSAAADAGFEQLAGRLAGAEAGQADLLGELLECLFEVGFQLGEGHLYIDANPGGAQLLDGALHGLAPQYISLTARGTAGRGDRI